MEKGKTFLIIFFSLAIMLNACSSNTQSSTPVDAKDMAFDYCEHANDPAICDDIPLADALKTEYPIESLLSFFSPYHVASNQSHQLSYSQVNEAFPIEVSRITGGYSVYKVKEGGYFYVFWAHACEDIQNPVWQVCMENYTYIPNANIVRDAGSLEIGKSTAADVFVLDPYCDLIPGVTPVKTYSYLDPDHILMISYEISTPSPKVILDNLIVAEISVTERTAANGYGSNLQRIQSGDLPISANE